MSLAQSASALAEGISVGRRPIRDLMGLPKTLAVLGDLEVRLATTRTEIRRAQKLRYRVFFEEGGAKADPTARLIGRDVCRFDRVCDHLIVVDTSVLRLDGAPSVVGAYRLLRDQVAAANFGFYSEGEFDVAALVARHPGKRLLELGRSCVASGYRGKRALELLWRGIWIYARHHRIDAMFGCASFPGADAKVHAAALKFLQGEDEGDAHWQVDALAGRAADLGPAPVTPLAARAAIRALPPMIKGYWRLGAKFSRQAVVDECFGATDVFAVVPVEGIESRYLDYFSPDRASAPLAA